MISLRSRIRHRRAASASAYWVAIALAGCGDPSSSNAIAPRVFDDAFDDGDLDGWIAHNAHLATSYVGPNGLVLEPNAWTYWYNANQSVQYYQLATGDFAITADVSVTSLAGGVVQPEWRIGAIQIRNPNGPGVDAYHAGFGQVGAGQSPLPIFETKNTDNSISQWWTAANASGSGQVRVCRAGTTVRSMWRATSEDPWILADERQRPDLPETLAAGPIAFNGSAQPGLRATFDDIRWHAIGSIEECGTVGEDAGDDGGGSSGGAVDEGEASTGVAEAGGEASTGGVGDGGEASADGGEAEAGGEASTDGGEAEAGGEASTGGGEAEAGGEVSTDGGEAEAGGEASTSGAGASSGAAESDGGDASEDGGGDGGEPPTCVSSFDGTGDITALGDEFDDPDTMSCWTFREDVEGTAPQYTDIDIDATNPGRLTLVPTTSGWYNDFDAPFLYKEVTGDFIIEASISASSLDDPNAAPSLPFNSAGILVRSPFTGPGDEDHLLFSLGAQWNATIQTEGKTTTNSTSVLSLTPGINRGRLRICRIGSTFYMARRLEGQAAFTLTHTYVRPDLPETLQAGLEATAWNGHNGYPNDSVDPDLVGTWDYVRFFPIDDPADCLAD